jgi:hypothetical protein
MSPHITYPDNEKIQHSLQRYFDHYHFNNGGYDDKTFTIKFWGPLQLTFPNITARVDAVKLHDIHHICTQFEANLRGEAEIGAWELAAGCGKYYAAWFLNAGSFAYGAFIWPGKIYRAFMWGRRSDSLYHHVIYKEYYQKLLSATVGELRHQLGIIQLKNKHYLSDNLLFVLAVLGINGGMILSIGLFVWLIAFFFR